MARVLMTADAVGGVWTYALELARALVRHGFVTTLATMGPRPSADRLSSAADIPGLEIIESDFRLEWMDDAWSDVERAGAWLLALEAQARPDIVHVNGYAHAALSWQAPAVAVAHSCVLSWAEAVGHPLDPTWTRRYHDAVVRGLHAAAWVVAPSAAMLAALQRHYGALPRASVVPNGRDKRQFRARPKEPFVFSAGRIWDRAKNIDALAAVAPRLSWPVVVAGDGDADGVAAHLGRLAEADLATWLSRASIFALPARYEPFGLLPLEAALAGCALVLGDIPSLREIWGDAADYVAPDDRDGLVGAIEELAASRARRARRAAAARARAIELAPARMADAYVAVYRRAAAARGIEQEMPCAS